MNIWGFTPSLFGELEVRFPAFLRGEHREHPQGRIPDSGGRRGPGARGKGPGQGPSDRREVVRRDLSRGPAARPGGHPRDHRPGRLPGEPLGDLKGDRATRRMGSYPGGLRSRFRSAGTSSATMGAWKFREPGPALVASPGLLRFLPGSRSDRSLSSALGPVPRAAGRNGGHPGSSAPAQRLLFAGASRETAGRRDKWPSWAGPGKSSSTCHWALVGSIEVPYLHGRLILGPDEVFTDESFVHPDWRRFGIYGYSSSIIRTAVRAKGFRTMYCAVASWNEVPRRIMLRSGMTEIARLRCRNVPGFAKVRWSGRRRCP